MRLMVEPDVKPFVHHTAIPFPVHWLDEVKAELDQYVQLEFIEHVPRRTRDMVS